MTAIWSSSFSTSSAVISNATAGGTVAVDNAGGGTAHTNMQPTIFELVIIKL